MQITCQWMTRMTGIPAYVQDIPELLLALHLEDLTGISDKWRVLKGIPDQAENSLGSLIFTTTDSVSENGLIGMNDINSAIRYFLKISAHITSAGYLCCANVLNTWADCSARFRRNNGYALAVSARLFVTSLSALLSFMSSSLHTIINQLLDSLTMLNVLGMQWLDVSTVLVGNAGCVPQLLLQQTNCLLFSANSLP